MLFLAILSLGCTFKMNYDQSISCSNFCRKHNNQVSRAVFKKLVPWLVPSKVLSDDVVMTHELADVK